MRFSFTILFMEVPTILDAYSDVYSFHNQKVSAHKVRLPKPPMWSSQRGRYP